MKIHKNSKKVLPKAKTKIVIYRIGEKPREVLVSPYSINQSKYKRKKNTVRTNKNNCLSYLSKEIENRKEHAEIAAFKNRQMRNFSTSEMFYGEIKAYCEILKIINKINKG